MTNVNNSIGYGSAARPQPPARRRANSLGQPGGHTSSRNNARPARRSLASLVERPLVSVTGKMTKN